MFLIFDHKEDCQKYLDRIHGWLLANCPGYNATCWDVPRETKDKKFYTQLPQEYQYTKNIYPKALSVKPDCKAKFDKGTQSSDKPEVTETKINIT